MWGNREESLETASYVTENLEIRQLKITIEAGSKVSVQIDVLIYSVLRRGMRYGEFPCDT